MVFGTEGGQKSVFKSGNAHLTINGKELYAIGAQVQFSRQVAPLNTIGKGTQISVGEPVGTFTCNAIMTKDPDAAAAFNLNKNGCTPFTITLTFRQSDCSDGKTKLKLYNCVTAGVTMTLRAGQGYVGEDLQVMFTDMEM
jgi:hypothetical protein